MTTRTSNQTAGEWNQPMRGLGFDHLPSNGDGITAGQAARPSSAERRLSHVTKASLDELEDRGPKAYGKSRPILPRHGLPRSRPRRCIHDDGHFGAADLRELASSRCQGVPGPSTLIHSQAGAKRGRPREDPRPCRRCKRGAGKANCELQSELSSMTNGGPPLGDAVMAVVARQR